jgi:hypothetical protein
MTDDPRFLVPFTGRGVICVVEPAPHLRDTIEQLKIGRTGAEGEWIKTMTGNKIIRIVSPEAAPNVIPVMFCAESNYRQPVAFYDITAHGEVMSDEDLKAELERLRNENAALKKSAGSNIRMKVSEKGAVSVYGMGRFPVTLYKEQWLKLLDMSPQIRTFIAENEAQLKTKG